MLLGRYVDNVYISLIGLPETCPALPSLLLFLEALLTAVYEIPMKWEKHRTVTDWCEGRLVTHRELALLTYQHPAAPSPVPDLQLWDKWVDQFSPNAQCVLRSMVPSLTSKVVVLAKAELHRQMNIASLVRGFTYKRYPRSWWWPALRSGLAATKQLHLVPHHLVSKWVQEGRGFRMAIGAASASHFAPALLQS